MTAICMAEVVTEKGTFRDYGDANPGNVDSMIIPHIIRMAVTRAKARAFRDAVNIGVVAIEDLGHEFGDGVETARRNRRSAETANRRARESRLAERTDKRQEPSQNGHAGNGAGTGNTQ